MTMSQEPTDLVAYKLWLVSSPFIFQPPSSQQPKGHVLLDQDRHLQLPVSGGNQFLPPVNGVLSDTSLPSVQQPRRGRKKSVSGQTNDIFTAQPANSDDRVTLSNNGADSELVRRLQSSVHAFSGSKSLADCVQYGGQVDPLQKQEVARTVCQTCGKWFRSRQQLTQHMLVHSDVRKYRCNFCGRAFKQPSHLQQHHRIHTGEKPYRCPLAGCTRAFPQLSNLNHHLRNHDKPDPPTENTCMFCNRTYASEAVLKNHMAKIHMYQCDSSPIEISETSNSESPSSVSGNSVTNQQTSNHVTASELTFSSYPAMGTYSEQLRNLASQPRLENVTSGQIREAFGADLIRAQAKDVLYNTKSDSFVNAMNAFQIFNTIPLEKIRRSTATMDQHRESNGEVEGVAKTSSSDSVTLDNGLSPGAAVSTVTNDQTGMSVNVMTGSDVNHRDAHVSPRPQYTCNALNKAAMAWEICNSINIEGGKHNNNHEERFRSSVISQLGMPMNEKTPESITENKVQRRKRAPVKLTSPGITTLGSDVSNDNSFSNANVGEISVCENYTYTLENSELSLAEWKKCAPLDKTIATTTSDSVVYDNSGIYSSSLCTLGTGTRETQDAVIGNHTDTPGGKAIETVKETSKFCADPYNELQDDNSKPPRSVGMGTSAYGVQLENGTEHCYRDVSEHGYRDASEHGYRDASGCKGMLKDSFIEAYRMATHMTESSPTEKLITNIAQSTLKLPTSIAETKSEHTGHCENFEKNRQTGALVSNSRKRKAFQPQRVVYDGEMVDYCM